MQPGQMPFRIAVIVSDAGTGGFQQGLANFMQKLLGQAEFSLSRSSAQPEVVSDYSSEGAVLKEAVRRVGPRGRARGVGAQLMEAIQDATRSVANDGRRPVILVLRAGGEAVTTLEGDEVREDLRKSGAVLTSSPPSARSGPASSARTGISSEQAQMQDTDNAISALNIAQVLGDGSKESGGRHDQVISTTLVPALERVADELLSQYSVTCVLRPASRRTTSCRSRRSARARASRRRRGCLRGDVLRQGLDHVPGRGDGILRRLAVELDRVDPLVAGGLGGLDDRDHVVVDVAVLSSKSSSFADTSSRYGNSLLSAATRASVFDGCCPSRRWRGNTGSFTALMIATTLSMSAL